GGSLDEAQELRLLTQALPAVGKLEQRAADIAGFDDCFDEAPVLGAGTDEIAAVRQRRCDPAMRGEVGRGEDNGFGEKVELPGPIVPAQPHRGSVTKCPDRAVAVTRGDESLRQPTVRIG